MKKMTTSQVTVETAMPLRSELMNKSANYLKHLTRILPAWRTRWACWSGGRRVCPMAGRAKQYPASDGSTP
jgi:hypothetical protein